MLEATYYAEYPPLNTAATGFFSFTLYHDWRGYLKLSILLTVAPQKFCSNLGPVPPSWDYNLSAHLLDSNFCLQLVRSALNLGNNARTWFSTP